MISLRSGAVWPHLLYSRQSIFDNEKDGDLNAKDHQTSGYGSYDCADAFTRTSLSSTTGVRYSRARTRGCRRCGCGHCKRPLRTRRSGGESVVARKLSWRQK